MKYDSFADGISGIRSVNEGKGFKFIPHSGEVQSSGFLPGSAGNVRPSIFRTPIVIPTFSKRDPNA